ncbi:MAG TPA: M56 family metallopeptidase [Candidatus Sulfotelmatobacter sp.]|nr:M56 family metallopeptidase [Candidatus Sulfotelmatobacter sp.]
MMPIHAGAESDIVLMQLAGAAIRSIALAAIAAILLRVLRVKATSTRLFTWTAVLYGTLATPLLGWVLPPLLIPMPEAFSRSEIVTRPSAIQADGPLRVILPPDTPRLEGPATIPHSRGVTTSEGPQAALRSWISWKVVATAIYLAVGVVLLARFIIGLILGYRLVKASQEIRVLRVMSKISGLARRSGSFLPPVRESAAISVPVTVGPMRSCILLPSNWPNWDDEKLDAVLAHKMSHVSRHDALSQCAALLYRAIFWFSPLAWWLNRCLLDLAEEASDEAALSGGVDRNHYARTLLGFFETLHARPHRVWWQGVSMANAGQAEKRLENILSWRGSATMRLKNSAVLMIVALAVPVLYIAAAAHPRPASPSASLSQQPAPPPASSSSATPPAEPAIAPATGMAVAPIAGVPGHGPRTGVPAPAAPIAGVPGIPAMPSPPAPAQTVKSSRHNQGYRYDFDDEQRFVIVTGNGESLTMSGSSEDAHHVETLRKQIPGDFIWFQRDEKSYIIRDQATIERARKLWAPQEELGKKQEELGRQQEALGKQQEELGARMEKIQVRVPDMTAQLDKLRAEFKALGSGATQEQIGNLQSEIGELQSRLGEVQSHAGEQQGKLGEEMGALGEKQGKLGEQQGELGRQQAELAEKAEKQMKELLDEAMKNGTAKPETGETGGSSL